MDVGVYPYPRGDPLLIDKIVNEFLSQGKFDKLRKECMSDADTKPAYQNLQQRVESTVTQFLKKQTWRPDLNKNQLRDSLRKHILESGFFDAGINRIVDQVVNPNVLATVFMPEVEEVVYNYLSIPRPVDKTQKKGPVSNGNDKNKSSGSENDDKLFEDNVKSEKGGQKRRESNGNQPTNQIVEDQKPKDLINETLSRGRGFENYTDNVKTEVSVEDRTRESEIHIKTEPKIKSEFSTLGKDETTSQESSEKMEIPSDESQESLNRMGVEGLQINEFDSAPVPDSDDSIPLEINEKSMSDSGDSDDSIMNQMSPISQGRLTPDLEEEKVEEKETLEEKEKVDEKERIQEKEKTEEKEQIQEKEKVEEKDKSQVKENMEVKWGVEQKRPTSFIGRIPKLKRGDSDSSKSSKPETPKKLDVKHVYSSDESDSSKSYGKSDSDERKSRDKKKSDRSPHKEERKHSDKERKHDDRHKSSKDRSHDRSSDRKDHKRDKSRERHGSKKSSSSSSRERSSSRHKSSHHSRHKSSKSRDHDKKRREEDKRKSKSTDDHGKERHKKEDRRSTDRDSNERERDKGSGSRSQGESRRREKEEKVADDKGDKTQKEDSQVENEIDTVPESGEVIIEMEEEWIPEDGIVLLNGDWIASEGVVITEEEDLRTDLVNSNSEDDSSVLDFGELYRNGVLTKLEFPKLTDDFYVKFNSTGFKYFEEWEKTKLDCEDEFKEFVDSAEKNLNLLSDDESDFETGNEFNFDDENQKTISNLLKGLGNFRKAAMFDPHTSEFYKWTNNKFYQKFRKKCENGRKVVVKNESDESIKENIERKGSVPRSSDGEKENHERENKALHLQLLNRYRRRALKQGRQRRRQKRGKDFLGGIKEKNENASTILANYKKRNGLLYKTAVNETESLFLSGKINGSCIKVPNKIDFNLVDGSMGEKSYLETTEENSSTSEDKESCMVEVKSLMRVGENDRRTGPTLPESPDENSSSEWIDAEKRKKGVPKPKQKPESSELKLKCDSIPQTCSITLNLPLSPDSDDVNTGNAIAQKDSSVNRKRKMYKSESEGGTPKKQIKRNYNQKYDNQDLYKPRPVLNSSRTRGRERGPDSEILTLESADSQSEMYKIRK